MDQGAVSGRGELGKYAAGLFGFPEVSLDEVNARRLLGCRCGGIDNGDGMARM